MKLIHTVSFFGYAQSIETDEEFIAAYDVAKLVAETGHVVVNGGGPGVMYAATKGAKAGGGEVEVVYYEPKHVDHFEGKMEDNVRLVDRASEESNYLDRTRRLLEIGDAYIVFNGSTGTVSEFAMAWALCHLYFEKHKPLIFYGTFWKNILDAFWKNMKVREDAYKVFKFANSPKEVVQYLEEFEAMYQRYAQMTPEECEGDECELFLPPLEHKRLRKEVKVEEKVAKLAGVEGAGEDVEAVEKVDKVAANSVPEKKAVEDEAKVAKEASKVEPVKDSLHATVHMPKSADMPEETSPEADIMKKLMQASE